MWNPKKSEPGPIKYINAAPRQSAAVRSETRIKYGEGRKVSMLSLTNHS